MSKCPNEWYLIGIKTSDNKVIRCIFNEYLPMISTFICSNNGTIEDANDIFMDAMEVIYRKVKNDELSLTANFSTYLFEICKRQWFKKLRRKKFESGVTIDDPGVLIKSDEVIPVFEQTERHKLLQEKFALLSNDCQKVLSLSWHTDKNMEEIANEMGWTYAYARKRKHLCKEILIQNIKDDDRFEELKN